MGAFPKPKLTIVSGFIALGNGGTKTLQEYLSYGQNLMTVKIPKVIFIDVKIFEQVINPLPEYNVLIPFKFEEMYYHKYLDQLKQNVVLNSTNPQKDTVEYFMIQCYKTEWVRCAIELNLFNTEQFMWIDFGIYHVFKKPDMKPEENVEMFHSLIYRNQYYETSLVRIPYVCQCYIDEYDPYKVCCWYFAGGVFGGHKNALIKFADLTKAKCLQIITERHWLMWEINIWAFVYKENRKFFELYFGNHDYTIFANYQVEPLPNQSLQFPEFIFVNNCHF